MVTPLVVFVYNRLSQTRQALEAVNKNILAKETELYVFSDGPRSKSDEAEVEAVRDYIKLFGKESNFRNVHLEEAKCNKGLADSIIGGVSKVISKYGRIIVLEDDLITSPFFLQFMNNSLDFYENNCNVWSIGGTTYQLDTLKNYSHDIYATWRGESCGWATWQDRWERVNWDLPDYALFMKDKKRRRMFQQKCGEDVLIGLKKQMLGWTDSWAIRWCYQEFKENMVTIHPKVSLVKDIGSDGSGTHSGKTDFFHTTVSEKRFEYVLEDIEPDEQIVKEFCRYFERTLLTKIYDSIVIALNIRKKRR